MPGRRFLAGAGVVAMSATAPSPDGRTTALVVDDEVANRNLIRAYLSRSQHVLEAANGAEALAVLEREQVDIVLLDVMMPTMNGLDACRAIKARYGRDRFLPVILLTALAEQEDRNAGLEAGADDFITKPFDRRELLLRVSSLLRLREQEAVILRQVDHLMHLQQLKDDLFSLIVHDLRNPLAGVRGFLHLLADAPELKDETRGWMRSALSATGKLQETLDDVLTVKTLEAGKLTLKLEPAPVVAVVRDAAATLDGALREKRLSIAIDPQHDVSLMLDRKLVRRSIENVLMNAIKYSRSGDAIEVAVLEHEGGAAIEVADRGPGVPESMKSEIFEKFATVESSMRRQRRGFGLGLYLVKLVATAHGGNVSVRDREGGGSVFRVTLPNGSLPT